MAWLRVEIGGYQNNIGGETEDPWSRDSYDGDAWVENVYLAEKDGYNHWEVEDAKQDDIVYAVLAVYGTGDSFGSTGGQSELFLVTKDKQEAEAKLKYLESVTDLSVPWNGYFEWLQEIKLSEHIIE